MKQSAFYNEETRMPFGMHKGSLLSDVPPSHLLWLYKQKWVKGYIRMYIFDHMDEIMCRNAINNGSYVIKK